MELWLQQNDRYFAGEIFKYILLKEVVYMLILLKFVTRCAFGDKSSPVDSPSKGPEKCTLFLCQDITVYASMS